MKNSQTLLWEDMQSDIGAGFALVLSVSGWLVLWYLESLSDASLGMVLSGLALMLIGLPLWQWAEHHPKAVAVTLVGVTFASVLWAHLFFGLSGASYFFVVPISLAGFVLSRWMVPVTAFCALGFLYAPTFVAEQGALDVGPGALIVFTAMSQFVTVTGVRRHLEQAWSYSTRISALAEEARVHRGEVSRLNKSLQLANSLLKRRAQELDIARYEAENARHLKEKFAVYVSHELRTPLNIMLGFLDVMQRYPEIYGEVNWTPILRRDVAEIQRSARYLSDLIDDLLDLARVDALKMPIRKERSDLEKILIEAVELTKRLLRDKPVNMRVIVPEALPSLHIDRTRIRQVMINLLANASRFTHEGEIQVRVTRRDSELVVAVADTGEGIPAEKLDMLFADFHQMSIEDSLPEGGKGLGLAIAKRFVKLHGGEIWAESQIGQGSTFYFSLPLADVQIARLIRNSRVQKRDPSSQHHLIVVDSDETAAAYVRRQLDGTQVSMAASLDEAQKMVRKHLPDAVLLNVTPEREETVQSIPSPILASGVPLLQCTLPVGSWLLQQEVFDDWLVKPIDSQCLLQMLAKYCPHGRKILLVDDDRSFVQLVRRIIQATGNRCDLQWAYSGEEGLAKMETEKPDLLLLDVALPGRDGRTIAQMVRQGNSATSVPIIAVSGLLPGEEGHQRRPSSFSITRRGGFSEAEVLELIQKTVQCIRPRYASGLPDSMFLSAPTEIVAS